ncbi:PAS domain S-box protein, partial [Haloferax profundi]|uniref:PAS domain S-box protein n=1 Tax=Haloferax profundi TaxID=1544718 RepID=UPI000AF63769
MNASAAREKIYDVFSDHERALNEQIPVALNIGRLFLDLPIGFLTRIDDGTQEIKYVAGDHESLQPGETCPLDDAYCRRTVEIESLLAVQAAETSSEVTDTAYETFGLETYIGAKVTVDDDVYGTVCFAAKSEREQQFTDAEELFLEILARLIGQAITRQQYERALHDQNERLEQEKQRFKGIAENSFDILFRLDTAGCFTYVSPAVERHLGYSPSDLIGNPFVEHLTSDTESAAVDAYD